MLNCIVKQYIGLPITKYCPKISLLQVKKMLVEIDSNVSEVMEKLGFKNANAKNRAKDTVVYDA